MFERIEVVGYDALKKVLVEKTIRTIILFTGSLDPKTGKSWCPDCVAAEPVVNDCVQKLQHSSFAETQETRFIVCNVGERSYWKDQSNPFRTDADFKVNCVPTLMDCSVKGKRLTEGQLVKKELLEAFFVEDAD